jgi:DNA-binding GntR family transcriptional regulator
MIYKTSRNAFLQEMLDSLKMKMQPLNLQIRPILLRLYQDHMEILETFRSKDPEAAERALVRHNRKVENQIRREIEVTSSGIRKSTGARRIEVR